MGISAAHTTGSADDVSLDFLNDRPAHLLTARSENLLAPFPALWRHSSRK
jgi:hypothetical protein